MDKKIYIIGLGRVGSALAFELSEKKYQINFLTDRNTERLKIISDLLHPFNISDTIQPEYIEASDIIFICVQDRYIREVIKTISEFTLDFSKKYFLHTSGAESTEVFSVNRFNIDYLLSLHPIQTFNNVSLKDNHLLENIYFGIEGGEKARILAGEIVNKLNSKIIDVPKDKKYLYHSACVISSNFLITLLNISSEVLGSIGVDKNKTFEIFKPIIDKTLENISRDGLVNSLTGPFERNDVETISRHLNSLNKELPSLIPFYTLLGMETVKIAFKKESINLKNVLSILDLMNEYILNEYNLTKQTIH